MGPEYLTLAFRFAHEADPGDVLYYWDLMIVGQRSLWVFLDQSCTRGTYRRKKR